MSFVLCVLLFVALNLTPTLQQYQVLTNSVLDYLLDGLKDAKGDSIPIVDINHRLPLNVGVVTLEHGVLNGLSGLSRAGDVKLTAVLDGVVEGDFQLHFKDLRVGYGEYKVKIGYFPVASGQVDAIIKQSVVTLGVLFQGSVCSFDLKIVDVDLDDFDVQISSEIGKKIFKYILDTFVTEVKAILQQNVKEHVTELVKAFQSQCFFRNITTDNALFQFDWFLKNNLSLIY